MELKIVQMPLMNYVEYDCREDVLDYKKFQYQCGISYIHHHEHEILSNNTDSNGTDIDIVDIKYLFLGFTGDMMEQTIVSGWIR